LINGNELTEADKEAEFIRLGRWDMLGPRPQYDTNNQECHYEDTSSYTLEDQLTNSHVGITTVRAKTIVGGVYDAGHHYRKMYKGVKLDPFRIADIYGCDGIQLTILKKCLVTGKRGSKDAVQDYKDIINAATRAIEILEEDSDEQY